MRAAVLLALALAAPAAAQRLTLEEKAAQLQNAAPAEPKLDLPAYDWWNEGLHGLARNGEATVFPQAIGLAATWDEALMTRVGDVVATEARAKWNAKPRTAPRGLFEGLTIWSPNINIFRDPRWGRGQETYGEDPLLSGRLGAAFVRGLQGPDLTHPKTIGTPKHLTVHSGPEGGRDSFSVQVAPRDLEETYLPAFRIAVTEGKALSLMCAYNGLHGTPVCALPSLMIDRLRKDWGFTGLTVSDCDAIGNIWLFQHAARDAAGAAAMALKGGTDLNCGGAYAALPDAVRRGLVDEAAVDVALARALKVRRLLAAPSAWDRISPSAVGAPAHRALALEAAEKSIVLLKNDAKLLPLAGKRVAVIGADADDLGVIEANYHGTAIRPVTPLEGIRARFSGTTYAQGSVLAEGSPVVVPDTALSEGGKPGLAVRITDAAGKVTTRRDRTIDLNLTKTAPFRASWSGTFTPPGPGAWRLVLGGVACWHACPPHDAIRLWIGDEKRIDGVIAERPLETVVTGATAVPIRIELDHQGGDEAIRLQWLPPAEPLLDEAERAARAADVVVAVVGLSPDLEGEALKVAVPGFALGDRTDVRLPEPQRRLLDRLAATGKPLVVVVTAGSAVALGDVKADAVLYAWYPGVEGGTALARILAGDVNPSGRMPVTVYASTADLPAFVDYGMKERTYRFFTGSPEWRFGQGASYTDFAYAAPKASAGIVTGDTLTVTVPVRNTGQRAGEEVVQAYVVPPAPAGSPTMTDPVLQRQLAAFRRIALKPGKAQDVTLAIDPRRMSVVDRAGVRRVVPGTYRLWVGGGQPGDAPGGWARFTVTGAAQELPK